MMISSKGRYALRVLIALAERGGSEIVPLREIAEGQDISEKYLESIARQLVSAGLLEGQRGKGGGYRLARAPQDITALEVLRLMEGTIAPVTCLGEGRPACGRRQECRTLPLWEGLDRVVEDYLGRYTVQDLARPGA